MASMTVKLRNIPDTNAAFGWAGTHSIIVDRPMGKAGGMELGFNGGQLLGLALGGCLCNDLHYTAAAMGIRLTSMAVGVVVTFEGEPLLATAFSMTVAVEAEDAAADLDALVRAATASSTVSNSVSRGIPVAVKWPGSTGPGPAGG